MAIIRKKELKNMDLSTLEQKLAELKKELNMERGKIARGGKIQSPGKVKELKRTISRILTFISQKSKEVKNSG